MANDNERSDVSLCFQALGIEFGAPPDEVEKAYQRMVAEIKRKQSSPDPSVRSEAANDLELAHDLYEKIRNSVTYNTKLREADQLASIKQSQQKKKEEVPQFKVCPYCSKTIGIAFKKCPFCRQIIRTPFEKFVHVVFSPKSLAVLVVLLGIAAGGTFLLKPSLFKGRKTEPVQDTSASFANQSGSSFANITGAAKKP